MYSARLRSLESESTQSDVVLFAPQVFSDNTAPVVDLPDQIRIPVYAERIFDLRDTISEMNTYSVSIDENIRVDTNGNQISDDDFSQTGSQISLQGNNLIIHPYTTLGTFVALISVSDDQ